MLEHLSKLGMLEMFASVKRKVLLCGSSGSQVGMKYMRSLHNNPSVWTYPLQSTLLEEKISCVSFLWFQFQTHTRHSKTILFITFYYVSGNIYVEKKDFFRDWKIASNKQIQKCQLLIFLFLVNILYMILYILLYLF